MKKGTVYVASGDSAAFSMAAKHRVPRRAVVALRDRLESGPLPAIGDVADWIRMRLHHYGVIPNSTPEHVWPPYIENGGALIDASRIVYWCTERFSDQITLAWLPTYLRASGADIGRLHVGRLPQLRSPGRGISRTASGARWLRAVEIRWLDQAWSAISAPEPHALAAFVARTNPLFPALARALRQLLDCYPRRQNGLGAVDVALLESARDDGPRAIPIVVRVMVDDDGMRLGDGTLFDHLVRLAKGPRAPLRMGGDGVELRSTTFELTDDGRAYLVGERNRVEANGIDTWVGGVHLDSANGPVWMREDDGSLVRVGTWS